MSTASNARRRDHGDYDRQPDAAGDLMLALDPALGVIDGFAHLTPRLAGLPAVVRAVLPDRGDGASREVFGRGATLDDALARAVAVGLERAGLEQLIRRGGHVSATLVGSGGRALVNAHRFAEQCSLGCATELAAAVEHATLESCERRALPAAIAAGAFLGRLDERGAPAAATPILDWHRARGPQVTSLLVARDTPVVACVVVPAMPDQAIVLGVAAGRTCAAAWEAAARELHQLFLARAPRDRRGELRHGGLEHPGGVVTSLERAPACDREALARAISATRRGIDARTVAARSCTTDAVAVELTTPAATRLGRRVVAVVTGESAERHALTLV